MALSYDVCVYILCNHPAISFSDRTGQSFQRPCGDRAETAQSSCSYHVILTTFAQKSLDARMMSLRVPYDYLKSLQSSFLPK